MQWIRQLDNSLSCLFGEETYIVSFNSQECPWNTYTGSVASRSVTTKTYDCQRHDEKVTISRVVLRDLHATLCAVDINTVKQAKSGDMRFMHVIIAVTDTTHATMLYKKRGVNWIPLLT